MSWHRDLETRVRNLSAYSDKFFLRSALPWFLVFADYYHMVGGSNKWSQTTTFVKPFIFIQFNYYKRK